MDQQAKKFRVEEVSYGINFDFETLTDFGVNVISEPNQQYDILRVIFHFLLARELSRAACVCKSWNNAACDEFFYRLKPEIYYLEFSKEHTETIFNTVASELYFKLKMKPFFGLIFARHHILPIEKREVLTKVSCINHSGYLFYHFPVKLNTLFIIHSWESAFQSINHVDASILTLFLPQIFNLQIKKCELLMDSFDKNEEELFVEFKKFLDNFLLNQEIKSSCVISLSDFYGLSDFGNLEERLLEYFRTTYRPGAVALCGAKSSLVGSYPSEYSNPSMSPERCTKIVRFSYTMLSSPALQSWSVELPDCTVEIMKEKLLNLKNSIRLKKYSVALLFCWVSFEICQGIFGKVFPDVPLINNRMQYTIKLNTLDTERVEKLEYKDTPVLLILTYE